MTEQLIDSTCDYCHAPVRITQRFLEAIQRREVADNLCNRCHHDKQRILRKSGVIR